MTDPMDKGPASRSHEYPTCGATNRQGQPCGNRPSVGATRCRFHGGALPQVRRKIEAETKRAEALELLKAQGVEPVADPVAALRDVAGESRILAAATRQAFAETAERDGMEAASAQPLAQMYRQTLDQTGRLLTRMAELGITPTRADALPALRSAAMLAAIAEAWRYGADGTDLAETIRHTLEDDYSQEVPINV